jgi:putative sigma-54 modulation protein
MVLHSHTRGEEDRVRIDVVGRNVEVTDELREHIHKRFARVARQVSELAHLEVTLREEANPAIRERQLAEATLHLKGATLHAEESAEKMKSAIGHLSDDMKRQVKRHRELRRARGRTRRVVAQMRGREPKAGT